MVNAFHEMYEFTNWEVIFRVFNDYRVNDGFIYALYSIVDVRLKKMYDETNGEERAEEFQLFEHCAVEYLIRLEVRSVGACVYVLKLIRRFDYQLKNLDEVRHFLPL